MLKKIACVAGGFVCRAPGRDSHMKGAGMLVVCKFQILVSLLKGVLGKTPLYLAVKVSFRVALEEILKIIHFQFVLFTRFM